MAQPRRIGDSIGGESEMNWEALGAIAESVGAVGVIASLLYVGLQVRQNTRSVRTATYEALVRSSGEFLTPLVQDPELAARFESAVGDWTSLEASERSQINFLFTQLFRHWENAFFQMRQGTLEPELWDAWRYAMVSYFHQPGVQAWWPTRRSVYSSTFRELLEQSAPPSNGVLMTQQLVDNPPDRGTAGELA